MIALPCRASSSYTHRHLFLSMCLPTFRQMQQLSVSAPNKRPMGSSPSSPSLQQITLQKREVHRTKERVHCTRLANKHHHHRRRSRPTQIRSLSITPNANLTPRTVRPGQLHWANFLPLEQSGKLHCPRRFWKMNL